MDQQQLVDQTTLSVPQRLFIVLILLVGLGFIAYAGIGFLRPPPDAPKVHLADAAKKLLRTYKGEPLSEPLEKILSDSTHFWFESEPDPLLNKPAPNFSLSDVDGHQQDLDSLVKRGPVLLIFYYGYYCDHCVSQLFDVNEDMKFFRELGVQVVAISADPPAKTLANYKEYGRFDFLVLSDPGDKVAQQYGVYTPKSDKGPEDRLHGTFIISRDGIMRWSKKGNDPFRDNRSLLHEVAKWENRLPVIRTAHTGN